MWQVLRRPRWLGYLALALVFAVVAALLGWWQWERHEDRVERRTVVESNYDATPVPVVEVLAGPDPLDRSQEWTKVSMEGSYSAPDQHLVRNRPHQGVFGYQVLVPLVLDDGTAVAVDRGWVRNAATAQDLPEVPAPPAGPVTVTGWVRPSEPDLDRTPVPGQLASVDLPRLAAATDLDLRGGYVVLEQEDPAPVRRPEPLDPPDTGTGSHFAYALQWWLTVPVGLILVLLMARREADDLGLGSERTTDRSSRPARTRGRGLGRAQKVRRARKVRIWDEEDG